MGILLLEAEDILDIGSPEAVDGLVVVAHHADILPASGQKPCQEVLEVVGILVLVDEDIAELLLVVGPHLLVLLEQMDGVEDNVVEVQGVGLPEPPVIAGIDLCDSGHPPVVGGTGLPGKVLRRLVLVLGVADDSQNGPRLEVLVAEAHVLKNVLDDPLAVVTVVYGKVIGKAAAQALHVPA